MEDGASTKCVADSDENNDKKTYLFAFKLLWFQCKQAYTNTNVQIWSIWYAVGLCGYLQVICYIQVLWTNIDDKQEVILRIRLFFLLNRYTFIFIFYFKDIWNGAVEACITLLGAGVALLAGYLHSEKLSRRQILWSLVVLSICEGCSILLASQTPYRNVSYVGYLLFCVLYSFTITVAR